MNHVLKKITQPILFSNIILLLSVTSISALTRLYNIPIYNSQGPVLLEHIQGVSLTYGIAVSIVGLAFGLTWFMARTQLDELLPSKHSHEHEHNKSQWILLVLGSLTLAGIIFVLLTPVQFVPTSYITEVIVGLGALASLYLIVLGQVRKSDSNRWKRTLYSLIGFSMLLMVVSWAVSLCYPQYVSVVVAVCLYLCYWVGALIVSTSSPTAGSPTAGSPTAGKVLASLIVVLSIFRR